MIYTRQRDGGSFILGRFLALSTCRYHEQFSNSSFDIIKKTLITGSYFMVCLEASSFLLTSLFARICGMGSSIQLVQHGSNHELVAKKGERWIQKRFNFHPSSSSSLSSSSSFSLSSSLSSHSSSPYVWWIIMP